MNKGTVKSVELSPDRVYDVLGHPYRRYTLIVLHQRPGPVDICELATCVAARDGDIPVPDVDESTRDRVLTSLYHNHLPRLAEVGIVEYDTQSHPDSVELVGDIGPLKPALQIDSKTDLREYHVD